MNKPLPLLVVCAACSLPACGGQGPRNGDEIAAGNEGSFDLLPPSVSCEVTEGELDPSAVTSLGFSAQAVLDLVVGEHTLALAWLDSDVEYGPESGRSELTLTITARGAPLLMDRELAPGSESPSNLTGDDRFDALPACRDSLRIPATVAIRTASGAFDEVTEGLFEAYEGDFAHGGLSLALSDLGGSFDAEPTVPESSAVTGAWLQLELSFSAFGSSGAFTLGSTFESTDAIGVGTSGEIAHFPADDYCGPTAVSVGADQTLRGLSVARALASLNAAGSTTVRYFTAQQSSLSFDFSSAAERACARFDTSIYGNWPPGIMTLDFPGTVQLTSTDGLIDGSVPVLIATTNETGPIRSIAQADVEASTDAASVAALPAQFGILDPIDVSEYDGVRVEFGSAVWSPGNTIAGLLQVHGLRIPDCVNNPPPRDPNATMTAPCATRSRTVWSASWDSAEE